MREIAIYGAGGFGREVALMIEQINAVSSEPWTLLGFFDDHKEKGTVVDGLRVLGTLQEVNKYKGPLAITLAIADPSTRKKIRASISNTNISFPVIIHPSVMLGDVKRNNIEEGAILTAGNILTTGIKIDPFAILNLSCTIGHDVRIGSFSSVMPGCSISGAVHVGSEVLIGTGARVLPGVSIGDKSKIGAGAVVLTNVAGGVTVVGVPGRPRPKSLS